MANVSFKKGLDANLNKVSLSEGQILVTTDKDEMYIDIDNENRKKITDTDKANKLDYTPTLSAGNSDNLISKNKIEEKEPYNFRSTGGEEHGEVGNQKEETIVGGTICWNQFQIKTYQQIVSPNTGTNLQPSSNNMESPNENDIFLFYCKTEYSDGATTKSHPLFGFFYDNNNYYRVAGMYRADNEYAFILKFSNFIERTGNLQNKTIKPVFQFFNTNAGKIKYENGLAINLSKMLSQNVAEYFYDLEEVNMIRDPDTLRNVVSTSGKGIEYFKKIFPNIIEKYNTAKAEDYINAGTLMSVKPTSHNILDSEKNIITSYPLGLGDKELKGIYKLDNNNNLYCDGDEYTSDGNVIRNYAIETEWNNIYGYSISNLHFFRYANDNKSQIKYKCLLLNNDYYKISSTWDNQLSQNRTFYEYPNIDNHQTIYFKNTRFYSSLDGVNSRSQDYVVNNEEITLTNNEYMLAYIPLMSNELIEGDVELTITNSDGTITRTAGTDYSVNYDTGVITSINLENDDLVSYTVGCINACKRDLVNHNVQLLYPLQTSITETAQPYTNPQYIDNEGYEEYVDNREVAVPVGHISKYSKDLKRKIENIPDPPSENGTYTLKFTKTDESSIYSWVADQ